jgi:hypothetical protein
MRVRWRGGGRRLVLLIRCSRWKSKAILPVCAIEQTGGIRYLTALFDGRTSIGPMYQMEMEIAVTGSRWSDTAP